MPTRVSGHLFFVRARRAAPTFAGAGGGARTVPAILLVCEIKSALVRRAAVVGLVRRRLVTVGVRRRLVVLNVDFQLAIRFVVVAVVRFLLGSLGVRTRRTGAVGCVRAATLQARICCRQPIMRAYVAAAVATCDQSTGDGSAGDQTTSGVSRETTASSCDGVKDAAVVRPTRLRQPDGGKNEPTTRTATQPARRVISAD